MLSRRYEARIGGEQRWLVNNLKAWLLFERRTGHQMGDVAGGPNVLRTLLWALLSTAHPDITEDQVGAVTGEEFREMLHVAGMCIRNEFPDMVEAPVSKEPQRVDWHELWAIGRYDLRLSDEEFWALSPRQFHHLMLRFDAASGRLFLASGIVAAAITNCHIDPEKGEPVSPEVFMPKRIRPSETHEEKSVNVMAKLREVVGILPGKFSKLDKL